MKYLYLAFCLVCMVGEILGFRYNWTELPTSVVKISARNGHTSILYDKKLIIIVCDNDGHMVINRLQIAKGGKEYISNLKAANVKNFFNVNFAEHAKSMGADAENVHSLTELEQAFSRAKKSNKTYIICIKTHGYHYYMTPETAITGIERLEDAINRKPKQWVMSDWPNLSLMEVFRNG